MSVVSSTGPLLDKRYAGFWLWIGGRTVSGLGTNVTAIAMPWVVLTFTHSAWQSGATMAAEFLPYLLFSIPAGLMVDTGNKKRMMIACCCIQAGVLLSVPLAASAHALSMTQVYLVSFLIGACAVWYNAGNSAVLPTLLPKTHVHEGNAIVQMSQSVASIAGTPLGGLLLSVLPAPWVLTADALSYLVIALSVMRISVEDGAIAKTASAKWTDVLEGWRFLAKHPWLRVMSTITAIANLANYSVFSILVYHAKEDLHLSSSVTAAILAVWGIGLLLGSVISRVLVRHITVGTIMLVARCMACTPPIMYGLSSHAVGLLIGSAVTGLAMSLWNIQSASIRQIHTPEHLRGRCSAAHSMFAWLSIPVGSAIGGLLTNYAGAHAAFLLATVLQSLTVLVLAASPVVRIKQL